MASVLTTHMQITIRHFILQGGLKMVSFFIQNTLNLKNASNMNPENYIEEILILFIL